MRVYLVNPGLQTSFWSLSEASDITGKPGYIPNLAPPTLAALTPPDVEVVICDETVEPVDLDMPCDLVGITGYVSQSRRMMELARMFRERGRLVAIGGPSRRSAPSAVARMPTFSSPARPSSPGPRSSRTSGPGATAITTASPRRST